MKVVVIGIGLIGGSMAKDLRTAYADISIKGLDLSRLNLEEAIELGLIDDVAKDDDLQDADIVIVCIPVNAIASELPGIMDLVGEDTLVFDAGSTKAEICRTVENHPKRRNFLACHPIAGTEYSGPAAAIVGLYKGKTNIICEVEKTAFRLQEKALDLFAKMGMRIRYMNPDSHDKHIAYVSHLSHISSFMLGKTVIEKEKNERDIFDMAGSGFESTVRLAKSSPAMWTPIFEQNKENIVEILESYIKNLEDFKQLLVHDNYKAVYEEMATTNKIKEILNGIPQQNKEK